MGWRTTEHSFLGRHFARWVGVIVCVFLGVGQGLADEVVLVYTGNTQSFLEVCGCTDNQLGGIARRATIVRDLKLSHPDAVLLDAGGLFAGDTALDQLRCRVHLNAMEAMGYHAVNVGAGELRFGTAFFNAMRDSGGVPFVSTNLVVNGERMAVATLVVNTGTARVGIVAVAGEVWGVGEGMAMDAKVVLPDGIEVGVGGVKEIVGQVERQADLVVLLSDMDLDAERVLLKDISEVDVVIRSRSVDAVERVGNALVLGTQPQGKGVGVARLIVENGRVIREQVQTVLVSEAIAEDKEVKGLVDGFYDRVENSAQLQKTGQPRFDGFAHEEQVLAGDNGYVGVEACASCHANEVADWEHSHHANAFDRLLQKQKHYQPDCVTCHTTGFGYATGFQIGRDAKRLTNVQCEVCHGPGGQHARRPEPRNIRRVPTAELCQRCHDENQTPDFDTRFAEMLEEVSHKGHFEGHAVTKEVSKLGTDGRSVVELFVMADCPYGIRAEQALAPVFQQLGDQIDFRLHFIADEAGVSRPLQTESHKRSGPGCEATTTSGTGRFRSLHGDPEVAEGIRQTVVMSLYPDRYWEYISCRNEAGIGADWSVCAQKVGMDVDQIAKIAQSAEGEALFAQNIRRANMLGINASPTLLINGREVEAFFDAGAVAQLICREDDEMAFCNDVPACRGDQDCKQLGKVGVCVNDNTPDADCVFEDPVVFEATILNDSTCTVCDTYPFVRSTLALFPGVMFNTVEVSSDKGQELVGQYGVDRVPSFVLDQAFEKTARFDRFAHIVKRVADHFVPDVRLTPVAQILNEQDLEGIDLFLDVDASVSLGMAERMLRWVGEVDAPERLRLHFVGDGPQNEIFRQAQQIAPEKMADILMCHIQGIYSGKFSRADCLREAGIQIGGPDNKAEVLSNAQALCIVPGMVPAAVVDGRFVLQASGLEHIEAFFYRLHPQLAQRDRNTAKRSGVQ